MEPAAPSNPFASVRRLMRQRNPDKESCELCGAEVGPVHAHLMQVATRKILCSCQACAILFSSADDAKYRRIPDKVQLLHQFQMRDDQWDNLNIPINLAFFFHSTTAHRVIALFPSPAGATESLLPLPAWEELAAANPVLNELQPDVEALLVNRIADQREYFRAPIDECFKLVGLIRSHWRGLSGGTEVWKHIKAFFDSLKSRSAPPPAPSTSLTGAHADA